MQFFSFLFIFAIQFFPLHVLHAQISMGATAGSNTQNFNGLGAGSSTFTDNSTIVNWYSQRTGTGTSLTASTGSTNVGDLYNYGSTGAADRALGSQGSGNVAAGNFAWGVLFQNNSGISTSRGSVIVSYTGEQWRNSAAAGQQALTCYYKRSMVIISNLEPNNNSTWTPAAAFDFTSPVSGGVAGSLNGNSAANRTVISATLSFTPPLVNGEYVMFKWDDPDHFASDHGLSTDDFTLSWALPSVLPVSLSAFEGYLVNDFSQLTWTTKSEINNYAFVIESSQFGRNFDSIGVVKGRGNMNTESHYSFLDQYPHPGLNYYRLKQIDLDRVFTYSKIISVHNSAKPLALVYPNPAAGFVFVGDKTWSPEKVVLTDRMGRVIQSWLLHADNAPSQLNLHKIPMGEYLLQVSSPHRQETVILLKH